MITLAAARFQLLISAVDGGLNLSIEEVVAKAKDYESRESKGVRASRWAPAVNHSLRQIFQITHCLGDSYIVADLGFVNWFDTIPLDLCQLAEYRVLINLCGHTGLPFALHDPEDVSRWTAQLPKYTVLLMNSLPKWACLAKGLRNINFHRLWKSTDSLVALAKGSWRKGELRLSKSDGIVIWVSEALYQDARVEEDTFVYQYDNWPHLPS